MSDGSADFEGMDYWEYAELVERGQMNMFVHQLYALFHPTVTGVGQGSFVLLVRLFSPAENVIDLADAAIRDPRGSVDTAFVLKSPLEEVERIAYMQQWAHGVMVKAMRFCSPDPGAPAWEVTEDDGATAAHGTVFRAGNYVVALGLAGVAVPWMPMVADSARNFFFTTVGQTA